MFMLLIWRIPYLELLELVDLRVFIKFGNFLATISPNIFFSVSTSLSSPSKTPITHILGYMKLFHTSLVPCSFFSVFDFFCFILVSTTMSSSSLIFSLAKPNLLLVPFRIDSISDTIPSIFKCSTWVSLYLLFLYVT